MTVRYNRVWLFLRSHLLTITVNVIKVLSGMERCGLITLCCQEKQANLDCNFAKWSHYWKDWKFKRTPTSQSDESFMFYISNKCCRVIELNLIENRGRTSLMVNPRYVDNIRYYTIFLMRGLVRSLTTEKEKGEKISNNF